MKWGDEKTMKFIRLYQQHPCLWDVRSPDYKNKLQRIHAYNELIKKMKAPNFGHRECTNKIKNIRSQYCQELKKIRVSIKIGRGVYKPSLLWFPLINSFLRDIVVHREQDHLYHAKEQETRQQGIEPPQIDDEETRSDIEFFDYSIVKEEESHDTESESVQEEPIDASSPHQTLDVSTTNAHEECGIENVKNIESNHLQLLTSAIQKIENIVTTNSTITEFDVFGQSVAAQLKSMAFDEALQLQLEIQQLITMRRIKKH
ncbi:uncharacterized protein [Epargyreus clarus]|uniref:uncharacterized protein n=1 Tax=Epargyreus clarus TaxID=520877 RepID=UPI003C2AB0B2